VTFAGRTFHVYEYYGLVPQQWLISIGIGFIVIPFNFLLKLIKVDDAAVEKGQVD